MMGDFKEDINNYFDNFANNIARDSKLFSRFDLGTDQEKKEVDEIYLAGVVSPIRNQNEHINISTEDVSNIVEENVEKRSGSLGLIQNRFHLFRNCNNWNDVRKEVGKFSKNTYKESIMIQTFAAGVVLVVVDNVTPVLRYVVGPSLIKTGFNNSKILQKSVKKDIIEKYVNVDYEKGIPSSRF